MLEELEEDEEGKKGEGEGLEEGWEEGIFEGREPLAFLEGGVGRGEH